MVQISRILVPVDFSPPSHAAVIEASALASHYHSELTILHVNELSHLLAHSERFGIGARDREAISAAQMSGREAELEAFAADDLDGILVRRLMRIGDPAQEIVKLAHEEKTDLILMPTHGYGPIRRLLLGSVAAKVLHDAECPVWTEAREFKPIETGPGVWRRVICGVRFGPGSPKAVSWAADFAAEFQAELIVAHAVPVAPPECIYLPRWQREAKRNAEKYIGDLIAAFQVKPTIAILEGPAPEALSEAARDYDAELLVIGRDCSSGLLGRLGRETHDIIRCAPCGVVSV